MSDGSKNFFCEVRVPQSSVGLISMKKFRVSRFLGHARLLCLQQIHMGANQMPANWRFVSHLRYRFTCIINLYTPHNYSAKYLASDIFHHKYPMVPYGINIHILNVLCQSLHKDRCKNNLHKYVLYNIPHNFRSVPKVIKLWIKFLLLNACKIGEAIPWAWAVTSFWLSLTW